MAMGQAVYFNPAEKLTGKLSIDDSSKYSVTPPPKQCICSELREQEKALSELISIIAELKCALIPVSMPQISKEQNGNARDEIASSQYRRDIRNVTAVINMVTASIRESINDLDI